MNTANQLFRRAQQLGACALLHGTESQDELLELFLTPQGVEFCQKNNFPDMDTLRAFRGPKATRHGVYIDAGHIVLHNAPMVALVGDTQAELHYDDPDKPHEVVLMHGAKAHIEASGYAVVFVTKGDCEVVSQTKQGAKIL